MEREYKRLLEEIRDAYLLLQDGKMVFFNSKLAELHGCSKGELAGTSFVEAIAPEEQERLLDLHHRRLAGQPVAERYETVILTKVGTRIPVEVSAWPTEYQGKPAVAVILVDITERKKYQAQILSAQEEERRRLAQGLHDDTIQELLLIIHRLQDVGAGTYGQLPKRARERLAEVRLLAEKTMIEIRKFTEDLRPDILDDMGLVPALRWLTDRLSSGDGVQAEVRVLGEERRLSTETELTLFRIAQEALSNVRKHARASTATLLLEFGETKVAMTISDDGIGFEQHVALSNHFDGQRKLGLAGISERVRLLGGNHKIESALGKGTIVWVEIAD